MVMSPERVDHADPLGGVGERGAALVDVATGGITLVQQAEHGAAGNEPTQCRLVVIGDRFHRRQGRSAYISRRCISSGTSSGTTHIGA